VAGSVDWRGRAWGARVHECNTFDSSCLTLVHSNLFTARGGRRRRGAARIVAERDVCGRDEWVAGAGFSNVSKFVARIVLTVSRMGTAVVILSTVWLGFGALFLFGLALSASKSAPESDYTQNGTSRVVGAGMGSLEVPTRVDGDPKNPKRA
jgi:hypothetical protein